MSETTTKGTCLTEGCGKPASMKCPKCTEQGRTSLFCSQECFKGSWATHKKVHGVAKKTAGNSNIPQAVASTEQDIQRATDTIRQVRELRAANAPKIPEISDSQKSKCEAKLKKSAGLSKLSWMTGAFKDALTPNTAIKIDTPRLTIRAVEPADGDWVYSVKGDPRVNKYQLYGQPTSKADANASFARGYIRDRIPILRFGKNIGGAHERLRYVFALSPKTSAIPKPASNEIPRAKGLPPFTPLPHEDTTYIGNIAFEVTPLTDVIRGEQKMISSGPPCLRIPPDNIFIWPDLKDEKIRKELDGWAALMFYEIAPQYWGQGLMSEAILAVSDFVFFELGLGHVAIDPQTGNSSSIALARKFPDMEYMSTIQCRASSAIHQHVFVASRDNYIKRFGRPSSETLPSGKRGCAWCYNPRAGVRDEGELCAGCNKRWYCGIECRAADWEVDGGHGQRCKRS